jgi:F0F1-type ATP synthase membrane subunit b/b'
LIIEDFYLTIMITFGTGQEKPFGEEIGVNEKHIQQVLDIEKQAQEMHEAAMKEAQQLPVTAEQEAQALIEKARAEAEQKAREMVSGVKADEENVRILSEAEEKNKQFEAVAISNLDRAVSYVLDRVIGRA